MKFHRKPLEVDAARFDPDGNWPSEAVKVEDQFAEVKHEVCGQLGNRHCRVKCGEGGHVVCPGDWIVRSGLETYPMKPAEFELMFEAPQEMN